MRLRGAPGRFRVEYAEVNGRVDINPFGFETGVRPGLETERIVSISNQVC